jgi:hypothetical protein
MLAAELQAMADATTDAARDSISMCLKTMLRSVLDRDSALTSSVADVPMSRVDAPDGSFRLFTWDVAHDDGSYRYDGLLLMKTRKGHELHSLQDGSGQIVDPGTAQLSAGNWYGALYYEVIPVRKGGRSYYTLLGWKGVSDTETRKVIDVLVFSGGMPHFGAPVFSDGQRLRRRIFAYTARGSMQLKWDGERRAIVLDHLSAVDPEFTGHPAFMAPDLSFDSYSWDKGRWNFERDIDLRQSGRGKPYNAPPKEQR